MFVTDCTQAYLMSLFVTDFFLIFAEVSVRLISFPCNERADMHHLTIAKQLEANTSKITAKNLQLQILQELEIGTLKRTTAPYCAHSALLWILLTRNWGVFPGKEWKKYTKKCLHQLISMGIAGQMHNCPWALSHI